MKPIDIVIATCLAILWGINYVAIKTGVMHFPPVFMMGLRFVIVAILLLPVTIKVPKQKWFELFLLSVVMGVLYFGILFTGTHYVPASEASIITQSQVPLTVLLSVIFLKEVLTWRMVLGIIIALLGVMVTVGLPERGGSLLGVILLLIASALWAVTSLQIKLLGPISPLQMNGAIASMAMPQLFIASYFLEQGQVQSLLTITWPSVLSLLFTVFVSSILCYSVWFKLIQKYDVNKVVPFSLLVPIFGVISSHVIAGEDLIPHIIIGGLICIAGLALIVVKKETQHASI